MSAQGPIAFFGATGGCANAALALALKGGFKCSALARNPSKLSEMLAAKGLSTQLIESNLQVIQGDARDFEAIKQVLVYHGQPVSKILSGIGMPPTLNMSKWDGKICQDTTKNILQAMRDLHLENNSHLVVMATTGISDGPQDVPLLMRPMYHYMLALPHADKKAVEQLVVKAAEEGKTFSGYTVVRPSFLTDGKSKGMSKIRVGNEEHPAIGYTISRDDVGLWMYEELLKVDATKWNGEKASITH